MSRPVLRLALLSLLLAAPALAADGGADGGTDGGADAAPSDAAASDGTVVTLLDLTAGDLAGADLSGAATDGTDDAQLNCDLSGDGPTNCNPLFQPPRSTGSCAVAAGRSTSVPSLLGVLAAALALALLRRRRAR